MANVIHYIVPVPVGGLVSDGGPVLDPALGKMLDRERFGTPGHYAPACNPNIVIGGLSGGDFHSATDQPYLVECPKCKATRVFKDNYRPHPSLAPSPYDQPADEPAVVAAPEPTGEPQPVDRPTKSRAGG